MTALFFPSKLSTMTENIRVFLRLRPLNKFETNRRSRSAVEVVDETRIAIDDPVKGDWEVDVDGVRFNNCVRSVESRVRQRFIILRLSHNDMRVYVTLLLRSPEYKSHTDPFFWLDRYWKKTALKTTFTKGLALMWHSNS